MLRKNTSEVYTISAKEGNRSKTGGTTGKSLEVLYTNTNTQERFALLEDENKTCSCGNNNPMVKEILGRIDDYIYSLENGKINLGNVSNTSKDTQGIIRFQAIQNELNRLELLVETDNELYNDKVEQKFIRNWSDRVGDKMEISINHMEDIPVERSGKFRIVKNNIKNFVD